MKETIQSFNVSLRLGEAVPYFEADSQVGRVKLSDYKGKWLVFFSYPADFTPVCASEVVAFSQVEEQLKSMNCSLLGLSNDSVGTHRPWLQSIEDWMKESIRFPIIGDFDGRIARQYGMIMPALSAVQTARCTFVIDPEQALQAIVAYPVHIGRNTEEVVRLVKALDATRRQGKVAPANWQPDNELISLPKRQFTTHK
jgi:peroxiredoxin (alkyl hydroperoxide reductase subunit C)